MFQNSHAFILFIIPDTSHIAPESNTICYQAFFHPLTSPP